MSMKNHLYIRNLRVNGRMTSLSLEPTFWRQIERLAGKRNLNATEWCTLALTTRPADRQMTSWIREEVLRDSVTD